MIWLSHENWELPILRIWLALNDVDCFAVKVSKIIIYVSAKKRNENRVRANFGRFKFSLSPFVSKMSASTN